MHWARLASAIVAEVIATSVLRATHDFTRLGSTLIALLGYTAAFAMLPRALRTLPLCIAYAFLSPVGIALTSLEGWPVDGQRLDRSALAGLALIVAGVLVFYTVSAAFPD
jgi:small multidrug resistance pump